MPMRLAHKKSRNGCLRCKSRRVKCTEERPSCAACFRHSLPCNYAKKSSSLSNLEERQPSSDTASATPSSIVGLHTPYSLGNDSDALDSEHFQRRLLELRLLHHYITVLAHHLPATEGSPGDTRSQKNKQLFVVDTVRIAFDFPFLLNTIFAISALHMTQPQPEPVNTHMLNDAANKATKVAEYAQAHRVYLNMAIRQQREALAELGPTNVNAVCLTSIFLGMIALKLLPDEPNQNYQPPLQWLSMAHAISVVVRSSQMHLAPDTTVRRLMLHTEPDFTDKEAMFNLAHIKPFQAILDCPENLHANSNEEEGATYSLAVAYMGGIYQAIQNRDPRKQVARRITSLAPMLPWQFITLVERKRPRALVIIAYVMAMSKYVDNYWFFRGTAEHEVYGIKSILPEDWQWAMHWPVEMLKTLAEPQYRNLEAPA